MRRAVLVLRDAARSGGMLAGVVFFSAVSPVGLPLVLCALSMMASRQRPNSSSTERSISAKGLLRRSASSARASRHWQVASTTSWVMNANGSLSPVTDTGAGRMGRSQADILVRAAACCCTRTSAASANCINVLRSELSSKFLQPTHLHILLQRILAS